MKSSNTLKIVVLVLIIAAFFYVRELNNSSDSQNLNTVKNTPESVEAKKAAPAKKTLKKISPTKKNAEAKKPRKSKIKRVEWDKYEYEIVKYKKHSPYKEDLSGPNIEPEFKNYGGGQQHSSIGDEINKELESIVN